MIAVTLLIASALAVSPAQPARRVTHHAAPTPKTPRDGPDYAQPDRCAADITPVSYTHLTLPTISCRCRSRWSPYH